MRHHVGNADNNRSDKGERGENTVANRLWKREEKEGWDYYTPCNMQDKNTTSLYINAQLESDTTVTSVSEKHSRKNYVSMQLRILWIDFCFKVQGNGISAEQTINVITSKLI